MYHRVASIAVFVCALAGSPAFATAQQPVEYRVLATSKTSTMQKEMEAAASAGFRFGDVMGGKTAFGGSEVVVVMHRDGSAARYQYLPLATSKTSTMQKEMQDAGDRGFQYVGQTMFKTALGGEEVVVILERQEGVPTVRYEYRLLATRKTSTLQKELLEAGDAGYAFVGLTIGKSLMGGDESVVILRRKQQ